MKRLTLSLLLLLPVLGLAQQSNPGAFTFNHNHHVYLAADQSFSADTSLHNINGLALPMPNTGSPTFLVVECHLVISQATAAVANIYGVQFATSGPSNSIWSGIAPTTTGATANTDTGTGATTVLTSTPAATSTLYGIKIHGFIEWPANTTGTLNIQAGTGNTSDALTVKRDSFCFFPGQ